MKKNTDLQILRAIAVSFVLYDHVRVLLTWGGAYQNAYKYFTFWTGVDIFFAISGFIIARGLIDSKGESSFSFYIKSFFIRRIFRIIPSAWFWLSITLVLSVFFGGEFSNLKSNLNDAKSVILQYANIHFFMCSKSLDVCGVNGRYWSLSLEEQFYFIIPFLIFFLRGRLLATLLFVIIISQLFVKRPIWDFMWAIRTDALCLGVMIAMAYNGIIFNHVKKLYLEINELLRSFLCWVIIFFIPLSIGLLPEQVNLGAVSILCAITVFLASLDGNTLVKNRVVQRILVYIGDRSFGIYLIHIPVYLLIRHIFSSPSSFAHQSTLIQLPLSIALTLLLAEINYIFIEKRMILKGKSIIESMLFNVISNKSR